MQYRRLGQTSMQASAIGLGCFGFTGGYGDVTEAQAQRSIARAVDLGINLFDTAAAYGQGDNERLLGRALKPVRDKVLVVTKCGHGASHGDQAGAAPEQVRAFCEGSLQRLGFEQIDLYLMHRLDRRYPIEEAVEAMAVLVRAGLVRAIGLPECTPDELRRAHHIWPVTAVEAEYSLMSRGPEHSGLLATLDALNISLIAYAPLGRGMLARPLAQADLASTDVRRNFPRFQSKNLEHNREVAQRLGALASARSLIHTTPATPAQLLLAWILHKSPHTLPIPGSRTEDHVSANAGACDVSLSDDEVAALEGLVSGETIAGDRAPANWSS